jgi:hypothetical protein
MSFGAGNHLSFNRDAILPITGASDLPVEARPLRGRVRMTGNSEVLSTGPTSVLLLESEPELRAQFSEALRSAGIAVTEAARVGDVERWPSGQTVVTDAERYTSWWKQVGAEHVIVLADSEREGLKACSSGATAWLPRSCEPEELVETVVKLPRGR